MNLFNHPIQPNEAELSALTQSPWPEYRRWLLSYDRLTLAQWQEQRRAAVTWPKRVFSVLVPVYNTPPAYLTACIHSVQIQSYPHWQLCLVDDGSTQTETTQLCQRMAQKDPRIHWLRQQNQGICAATNAALVMAQGDYVAFLDHDDRLAPHALFAVARLLCQQPDIDIVYSDRDMLDEHGQRFMHLFKPDWSPETLLSGNYLFHLLIYRKALVMALGGLRVKFEGSQDFDLILRASDEIEQERAKIYHLPQVLYHWRQHPQSVALNHNAKTYAYAAGIAALQQTLQRRGLNATVHENPALWRGNYVVEFKTETDKRHEVIVWQENLYIIQQLNQKIAASQADYIVLLHHANPLPAQAQILALLSWLQGSKVGMTTGKIVDDAGKIIHAGLVQRLQQPPLAIYADHFENSPSYLAATAIVRNVSCAHPAFCAFKKSLWQQLGGFDEAYHSMVALLDFSLNCLKKQRIVYNPHSRCIAHTDITWSTGDLALYQQRWKKRLHAGDPYYNPWLSVTQTDMGLDLNGVK